MRKFIINLPIEAYVIYLPSILFLLGVGVFVSSCQNGCFETFFHGYFTDILFKNNIVYFVIFPLIFYFAILLFWQKGLNGKKLFYFGRSFTFAFGSLYAVIVFLLLLTQLLFNTMNHGKIVRSTLAVSQWDKVFFGNFSWSAIQGFFSPGLEAVIFNSYFAIVIIVFATIFTLLFLNKFLFRKFVLAYFLAFLIGLPFWITLPTLGPNMMFRVNQLGAEIPKEESLAISRAKISQESEKVLNHFSDYYYADKYRSVDITSFPSMHSAWGLIVVFTMIEALGPVVGIFLIPWLIFMLFGTVLTMQHYGIDAVFGIVVGFVALYFAKILLRKEEQYFQDKYQLFYALDLMEQSTKKFAFSIKSKIEKFLF